MTSKDEVEQCRIAYESHYENVLRATKSEEQAVESCTHYYLDGKPIRKGLTVLKCSKAFWSSKFWQDLPVGYYDSDPIAYALGRSLHIGFADRDVIQRLLDQAPETLKRGIRYSQVFLQQDSLPWQQVLLLPGLGNEDFFQFLKVCQLLSEELHQHNKIIIEFQKQLDELTIFEFFLHRDRHKAKTGSEENAEENTDAESEIIVVSGFKPEKIPPLMWRECIKKIWEVDPLVCPHCGSLMKLMSFIYERLVIKKILDHLGLYEEDKPKRNRAPPVSRGFVERSIESYDDGWSEYEEPSMYVHRI